MLKKSWTTVAVPVIVVLIAAVWYVTRNGPENGRGDGREKRVVYVGAILPLTGSGAEFGKDELAGAQLAVDRINSRSLDVTLELLVEDSRTQAKDGVSAYRKLMGSGKKPIAIITAMSSVSTALVPLTEADSIPLFCVAATPTLTKGNDHVFRSLPAADYQAKTLLQLSQPRFEYQSVAVLYINDDFGTSMESAFAEAAKSKNIEIRESQGVQSGASDFRAAVTKLVETKPDAVYIAAFGSELGTALRQLHETGYAGTVLTTLEVSYDKVLEVAGDAAEGAVFVDTQFDPSSSDPDVAQFVDDFRTRENRQPTLDAILAYDEIQMIFRAGKSEGFTSDGIRVGLFTIQRYESVNGQASMLPTGDVVYDLRLEIIKNGKAVPLQGG